MNAERRKRLDQVICELESLREDEQSALDGMPENLQGSQAAEKMGENVDAIQEALDSLGGVS